MNSNFINLLPKSFVSFENEQWEITVVYDTSFVAARNVRTNEVRRLRVTELSPIEAVESKPLKALAATVDESAWQDALEKYNYIQPLLALKSRSRTDVQAVAEMAGVTVNTVYRWIRDFSLTGQISSLIRQNRNDRGNSRLSPEVELLINSVIHEQFLNDQRRKASTICEIVRHRCMKAGLTPPHNNTVRNRIFKIAIDLKMAKRLGRKHAKAKLEPIRNSFPGADYPLAVVQIDHTEMDVIIVDEHERRPIGRPWLTLAFDVFSRMVCGFYIALSTPGTLGTALCISHALLPKDQWLAKRGIGNQWPVWGKPACIHLDNGKEFRGNALKRACEEYGIRLEWRPVATPHWGGHIERQMGTLAQALHELPGTTFSNPIERGKYDSEAKAALTITELEQWLGEYITGVYHRNLHSAISMPPEKKWEIGILGDDNSPGTGLPARPINPERILLDFLPIEHRTIQRYGVVIEHIHYYSDVLRRYINPYASHKGAERKFTFRYDPRDMSRIFFLDPDTNEYFEIPYRDMSHPPLSLWEIREARKHALKLGYEFLDEQAIFESHERLRHLEESAKKITRKVRRTQALNQDKVIRSDTYPRAQTKTRSVADNPVVEQSSNEIEAFDDIQIEVK